MAILGKGPEEPWLSRGTSAEAPLTMLAVWASIVLVVGCWGLHAELRTVFVRSDVQLRAMQKDEIIRLRDTCWSDSRDQAGHWSEPSRSSQYLESCCADFPSSFSCSPNREETESQVLDCQMANLLDFPDAKITPLLFVPGPGSLRQWEMQSV